MTLNPKRNRRTSVSESNTTSSSDETLEIVGDSFAALVVSAALAVGTAGVVFIYAAPFIVLNAFVVMKLWNWFLVPIGAPAATFAASIGVTMIARLLQAPKGRVENGLAMAIAIPVATLVIGFLFTCII